jgi:alkylation response protein AidB-like acyl-CoA dehydrogenase
MTVFAAGHEEFRRRLRELIEERFTPHAAQWEAQQTLPRSVFEDLGSAGALGVSMPAELGGGGQDFLYSLVLAEELPRSLMMGLALSVLAQSTFFSPLLIKLGSAAHHERFLRPSIRGQAIGALAVTEPTGGSDITQAVQCQAEDHGDFWIVTGEKMYITNGPIADFVLTLVRTRPDPSPHSFTLLLVPTDTPGFAVKQSLRKLGMHTSPTGWLGFDHCRIPKDLTLGKPGLGYFYVSDNLHRERLLAGAAAVAAGQLVLDATIAHVQQRPAYGRRLADLQSVRHRISDIAADLEMARRFVHSVCVDFNDGRVAAKEISMIKFKVIEIVQHAVTECLQLHGGSGFMEENWVSRVYRDVRVLSLGGGASELMKDLVAGYLRL